MTSIILRYKRSNQLPEGTVITQQCKNRNIIVNMDMYTDVSEQTGWNNKLNATNGKKKKGEIYFMSGIQIRCFRGSYSFCGLFSFSHFKDFLYNFKLRG